MVFHGFLCFYWKENFTLIIFVLIGLGWDSITLFTKMNFFPSKTHISTPFTQDIYIYMVFHEHILMTSWGQKHFNQLSTWKRILFMSSDKKKWKRQKKTERQKDRERQKQNMKITAMNKWLQCKWDTRFKFLRGSRWEVFCKKGVLRNFAKITGKNLCQSLFLIKVAGLRPLS